MTRPATKLEEEFDRQVETLIERGYPALSRMTERAFRKSLEPLRASLAGVRVRRDVYRSSSCCAPVWCPPRRP